MPAIPPFPGKPAVLPPFFGGEPTERAARSPYKATMLEVVDRFALSPRRCEILEGFIRYRRQLRLLGIPARFQWVAGSFVENLTREPGDVDVITFHDMPADDIRRLMSDPATRDATQRVAKATLAKAEFQCDAYLVTLRAAPGELVGSAHYWYGLFSHQRDTFSWKGLVQVDGDSSDDDRAVEAALAARRSAL